MNDADMYAAAERERTAALDICTQMQKTLARLEDDFRQLFHAVEDWRREIGGQQ